MVYMVGDMLHLCLMAAASTVFDVIMGTEANKEFDVLMGKSKHIV